MARKKSKIFTKKKTTKMVVSLCALGLLLCVSVFGIISPVRENTYFRLDSGAAVGAVATELKQKNIIISENLFKAAVLVKGGRVQSGVYEIRGGASMWRIARMMTKGDIASVTVVIPEGMTVKQIKKLLIDTDTLIGDVECVDNKSRDVCNLGEGDLFPDTYRVPRGISRIAVLELSQKKMLQIKDGWEHSGKAMPAPLASWNEVITLASIIQKETPKVSEMPTVASVYLNRLKKKMKLQADPTVVYAITNGLGDMQGKTLYTGHLQFVSPYNTYTNYGLPPAPIANVGRDAIAAVLNPADTTYLFFVADGQGGHNFSRSYEEHQKNHANWRQIKKSLGAKK